MFRIVVALTLLVSLSIVMVGCVDGGKAGNGSSVKAADNTIPRIDPKKEKDLVSPDTDVAVTITVKNQTKSPVSMHWLNETAGDRVHYHDIKAGAEILQETFQGHYWIILDKGGKALGIYETPAKDAILLIK
ncbi:MAG: hypothetical protein QGH60_04640 [Phycisphaerae bacterium]|jgi:hypothetical protein|nr:hypothetical protein [Phycisphaerae bacterium]